MMMRTATTVDPRTEARDALAKIARFFLFISLAMAAVVPHSFQEVEAATFAATTLICLVLVRRDDWLDRVILAFFAATAITAAYIWIGYSNGAPRAASNQTLFVYIIAPFMWIIMSTAMLQYVGVERVTKWLIWFTWAAVASVAAWANAPEATNDRAAAVPRSCLISMGIVLSDFFGVPAGVSGIGVTTI